MTGEAGFRVLGVDPGSQRTGFALAVFRGDEVVGLELGVWRVPEGLGRADGLGFLARAMDDFLEGREVDVAAVETPFTKINVRSALVLAEARGALLATLGRRGVPVAEYPPATVKKTICGAGAAEKEQVRRVMLLTVRGLRRFDLSSAGLDATDALALAVTHQAHGRIPAMRGAGR
ncbi:MAG: crossover junction endodeoxyribonuclease RuvC [Candidatus Polarisedimenticolia bacterium]|nr:crossover junction endodeoxyribonuclease RuvC [bacterium]